ncbi:MAG TPA: hypothetical protein VKI65_11545, partial [Gemmataceae bacterium]|nr:hypothetical protein [Gemmataceae bacterium]
MSRVVVRALFALALTLLLPGSSSPDEKKAAGGKALVAEKAAREILARFDKGDPGWKVRTEALVRLARIGRACVPVLAEALEKGAPTTREFAAQALILFAD